jgi:hypothetical protein
LQGLILLTSCVEIKKYGPVVRKHAAYKKAKIKQHLACFRMRNKKPGWQAVNRPGWR